MLETVKVQQAELETLELLLDEEAFRSINQSLKELVKGGGIPIHEWRTKAKSIFFMRRRRRKEDLDG
ncbi:hypothetical protein C4E22_07600 [ANME-1 cluster archaeon AG-394-G06]|nr:hypothetical protein [ANME-1 cluster archaeon AG-394-G06]